MSTMYVCPKCGKIVHSDKKDKCIICKTIIIDTNVDLMDEYLEMSEEEIKKWKQEMREKYVFNSSEYNEETYKRRELKEQQESEEYDRIHAAPDQPQCPNCGSTAITANKKGFSLGKAAVGGVLLGGVGLLGGFAGSRKIEMTCLSCGKSWQLEKK